MRVFLCGDVMTGRGIDQILRRPSEPTIYEPVVRDARDYVALAERVHGPIDRGVDDSYVWGDAIDVWREYGCDLCVMNLETSITRSGRPWPDKGIHYRMHPANARVLRLPGEAMPGSESRESAICYTLANNHVMDFGHAGLLETLDVLDEAGCGHSGAGRSAEEAAKPFRTELLHSEPRNPGNDKPPGGGPGTASVFGVGVGDSGIPAAWAAGMSAGSTMRETEGPQRRLDSVDSGAGVHLIRRLNRKSIAREVDRIASLRRDNEPAVVSVHWGGNWGWDVPPAHRAFAHALIDGAGVSVVHGHSSHHVKCFEVYHGGLILYGAGDFITDYEGIPGHDAYRPDLSLMYFADIDRDSGALIALRMVPMRTVRFSLRVAGDSDLRWLASTLNRDGERFGTHVEAGHGEIRYRG